MQWNNSLIALSLLLAGCGGAGANYAAETMAPAPGSPAAQSWQGGGDTWRAADGSVRSRPRSPRIEPGATPADTAPAIPLDGPEWSPRGAYNAPGTGAAPQEALPDPVAAARGPVGSSRGPGEQRYDEIGYAGVRAVAGGGDADGAIVAVHRSLAPDTIVEVTALDTGRTILVLITGSMEPGADHPIDLSAGAARQLGAQPRRIPVRIRTVAATPMDVAALHNGRAAGERSDAPPVLLTALRKRLPAGAVAARPVPPRHAAAPVASPRPTPAAPPRAVRGRYFVQVAALSSAGNAQSLAHRMGGFVKQGGGLHRVQLGPFATQREAEAARAGAARAGYGDARVFAVN
ncbi:SPOR domain-containing protein [Sphingomonas sp. MMS12-HWE2-04]|uniref:SPOR domain-containing protein n=1 Tax=Sphingomonas sp. MMS12-HWE2-04 TaxID=3234199 RepID=UPI00384E54CF